MLENKLWHVKELMKIIHFNGHSQKVRALTTGNKDFIIHSRE